MRCPFFFWRIKITIQHRNIPDAQLHEPKGVSAASANQVYTANGSGSGVWKRPDTTVIAGMAGDGGSTNLIPVSNGSNGFTFKRRAAYGSMTITNNTNNFAVPLAADLTLNTNSDYVLFTGTGAPWAFTSPTLDVTFNTDRMIAPVTGVYEVILWANISSFPSNVAKVGLKYRVNGTNFSPRKVVCKSNSAGDYGSLNGSGLVQLTAGDYIQIMFASTVAGGLIVGDLNATIILIKAD